MWYRSSIRHNLRQERMFLMCEDVDISVCETAIEMMSHLYDRKLLTDVELAAVSELIFAVNKTISTAVWRCITLD